MYNGFQPEQQPSYAHQHHLQEQRAVAVGESSHSGACPTAAVYLSYPNSHLTNSSGATHHHQQQQQHQAAPYILASSSTGGAVQYPAPQLLLPEQYQQQQQPIVYQYSSSASPLLQHNYDQGQFSFPQHVIHHHHHHDHHHQLFSTSAALRMGDGRGQQSHVCPPNSTTHHRSAGGSAAHDTTHTTRGRRATHGPFEVAPPPPTSAPPPASKGPHKQQHQPPQANNNKPSSSATSTRGAATPSPSSATSARNGIGLVLGQQYTGIVKRYNPTRGFGFLRTDGGVDVFVHQSCIQMEGFRAVNVGARVRFGVAMVLETVQAVDVVQETPYVPTAEATAAAAAAIGGGSGASQSVPVVAENGGAAAEQHSTTSESTSPAVTGSTPMLTPMVVTPSPIPSLGIVAVPRTSNVPATATAGESFSLSKSARSAFFEELCLLEKEKPDDDLTGAIGDAQQQPAAQTTLWVGGLAQPTSTWRSTHDGAPISEAPPAASAEEEDRRCTTTGSNRSNTHHQHTDAPLVSFYPMPCSTASSPDGTAVTPGGRASNPSSTTPTTSATGAQRQSSQGGSHCGSMSANNATSPLQLGTGGSGGGAPPSIATRTAAAASTAVRPVGGEAPPQHQEEQQQQQQQQPQQSYFMSAPFGSSCGSPYQLHTAKAGDGAWLMQQRRESTASSLGNTVSTFASTLHTVDSSSQLSLLRQQQQQQWDSGGVSSPVVFLQGNGNGSTSNPPMLFHSYPSGGSVTMQQGTVPGGTGGPSASYTPAAAQQQQQHMYQSVQQYLHGIEGPISSGVTYPSGSHAPMLLQPGSGAGGGVACYYQQSIVHPALSSNGLQQQQHQVSYYPHMVPTGLADQQRYHQGLPHLHQHTSSPPTPQHQQQLYENSSPHFVLVTSPPAAQPFGVDDPARR